MRGMIEGRGGREWVGKVCRERNPKKDSDFIVPSLVNMREEAGKKRGFLPINSGGRNDHIARRK